MVKKYGGVLVHSSRDEAGILEVVDAHGVRSLHFGTYPRQSAMSLADPDRLELIYVRAMLLGLLFTPEPRSILLLGLGGGSLAKFLFQNFPACRIEAVECRSGVAPVAQRFFGLPEDPRLAVHVGDCNEYVCGLANPSRPAFDLILVDAFDHRGLAESVNRRDFFIACSTLLGPEGVFAVNLWGSEMASYRQSVRLLNTYFDGRIMRLPVPGKGNVIGYGLGSRLERPPARELIQRARALEIRLGIEFPRFLQLVSCSGWR
jgi:spermidine synthase